MAVTARQSAAFAFILAFIREKKYSPSLSEIAGGIGITSLGTVHKHLKGLEKRGLIQRNFNCSRSIQVLHKHCPFCFKPGKDSGVF